MADEAGLGQWLSLAEVRDRTGRNIDGLRSWAKRGARSGKLRVRKNNRGEVQVLATPTLLAEFAEGTTRSALGGELVDGLAGDLATAEFGSELHQALNSARLQAASSAAEVRRLEAHLDEVRRTLESVIAAERARADRLAAELAEARKPMLVRLVEAIRRR
jgi:hypothetical protein